MRGCDLIERSSISVRGEMSRGRIVEVLVVVDEAAEVIELEVQAPVRRRLVLPKDVDVGRDDAAVLGLLQAEIMLVPAIEVADPPGRLQAVDILVTANSMSCGRSPEMTRLRRRSPDRAPTELEVGDRCASRPFVRPSLSSGSDEIQVDLVVLAVADVAGRVEERAVRSLHRHKSTTSVISSWMSCNVIAPLSQNDARRRFRIASAGRVAGRNCRW